MFHSKLLLLPLMSRHQCRLLSNMNTQINCSSAFKRFANASQAEVAKIREDRHEKATKQSTFWAVNVFEGKTDILKFECQVISWHITAPLTTTRCQYNSFFIRYANAISFIIYCDHLSYLDISNIAFYIVIHSFQNGIMRHHYWAVLPDVGFTATLVYNNVMLNPAFWLD